MESHHAGTSVTCGSRSAFGSHVLSSHAEVNDWYLDVTRVRATQLNLARCTFAAGESENS
eukprot:957284-Amphidinium_carterae.1